MSENQGTRITRREFVAGTTLSDCDDLFGDTLDREVTWKGRSDVSALAGKPLRLRFVLRDADLFSLRFAPASASL